MKIALQSTAVVIRRCDTPRPRRVFHALPHTFLCRTYYRRPGGLAVPQYRCALGPWGTPKPHSGPKRDNPTNPVFLRFDGQRVCGHGTSSPATRCHGLILDSVTMGAWLEEGGRKCPGLPRVALIVGGSPMSGIETGLERFYNTSGPPCTPGPASPLSIENKIQHRVRNRISVDRKVAGNDRSFGWDRETAARGESV
jgi:hypothetical protein